MAGWLNELLFALGLKKRPPKKPPPKPPLFGDVHELRAAVEAKDHERVIDLALARFPEVCGFRELRAHFVSAARALEAREAREARAAAGGPGAPR